MEEIYVITEKGVLRKQEAYDGFIREISTKEALEELIERMPYIQTIKAPNSKVRKELYQLSMKEYDDVEWVKVIKSVYLRMEEKRYDEFEPEYIEKAKKFLYQEIAIQYQIHFEKVEEFINAIIEKQLNDF